MKLDVGAGDDRLEGWTTVDLYVTADVEAASWDLPYEDGTIEEIRCVHMLEHLSTEEVFWTLAEFYRVLVPGGLVMVEVPDLDGACRMWLEGHGSDRDDAYQMIYGAQTRPGQFHRSGFNAEALHAMVNLAGFETSSQTLSSYGLPGVRTHGIKP